MSAREIASRTIAPELVRDCNIVLYEDDQIDIDLFPLAVLRPAWEIRVGMGCLREWVQELLTPGFGIKLVPRAPLKAIAELMAGDQSEDWDDEADVLFLNGRVIAAFPTQSSVESSLVEGVSSVAPSSSLCARIPAKAAGPLLALSGNEIAARLVQMTGSQIGATGKYKITHAAYIWDYVGQTAELLRAQLGGKERVTSELMGAFVMREPPAGVQVTDRVTGFPVYIGPKARLMPGLVFGNHAGPVWIGSGTEIEPHSYIEGPACVGRDCRIKAGCRVYHGTSIGPVCRVAGEISESLFQGYANKQHDGFVGNSHIASWVNLGADTRTSNLRNDYGEIKVQVGDRRVNTGRRYLGLISGDHTKTGINTMFNTGTIVGIAANVYGAGYPPAFIDSYMWGGLSGMKLGELSRTLSTAAFAMSRRNVQLTEAESELIARHYAVRTTKGKSE